jgi:hypothetical protein
MRPINEREKYSQMRKQSVFSKLIKCYEVFKKILLNINEVLYYLDYWIAIDSRLFKCNSDN